MKIVTTDDGVEVATAGLRTARDREIYAKVDDASLADECRAFIRYVAE